jgi:hypothetical protein
MKNRLNEANGTKRRPLGQACPVKLHPFGSAIVIANTFAVACAHLSKRTISS